MPEEHRESIFGPGFKPISEEKGKAVKEWRTKEAWINSERPSRRVALIQADLSIEQIDKLQDVEWDDIPDIVRTRLIDNFHELLIPRCKALEEGLDYEAIRKCKFEREMEAVDREIKRLEERKKKRR